MRRTPVFRDYFLFGLGVQGLRHTDRHVFNNIFVQEERVPGASFVGLNRAENLREGGNLLWGMTEGPELARDVFVNFRASRLFVESRKAYPPGWTALDRVADPKFIRFSTKDLAPVDLRLQADSAAINAGLAIE